MPNLIAWRIKMAIGDIRHAIAAHCDAIPSKCRVTHAGFFLDLDNFDNWI